MRGVKQKLFRRRKSEVQGLNPGVLEKLSKQNTSQLLTMTYQLAVATLKSFWRRHKVASRILALFLIFLILFSLYTQVFNTLDHFDNYETERIQTLLPKSNELYAKKLVSDNLGGFVYNEGYTASYNDVAGTVAGPKFNATFGSIPEGKVTVTDSQNQVSFAVTPKFLVDVPVKDDNRVIYPVKGRRASIVYTAQASSVKEDIILYVEQGDALSFEYTLELGNSLEPRLESDGSIGVYGVDGALLGNVTTGSENDAQLLEKARKAADKTKLLFIIPAPSIAESGKSDLI